MSRIDPRIVVLSVEVDGRLKRYEGLAINASGTKYANALQNEAVVEVFNLEKETRDCLLSETSPYNHRRKRKRLLLEAGRESVGVFPVYSGDITSATVSQPPDVKLTLKARTGFFSNGTLVARAHPTVSLKTIAAGVARDLGLKLVFEAKEKRISNYAFTGGAGKQVEHLASAGEVDAFVDDDLLVVKDVAAPLRNVTHTLSEESGMIGIPELTERGVKATMLLVPGIRLGSNFTLKSNLYPAINGDYTVYKLDFDISSRDTPFYWIAECRNRNRMFIKPGGGYLV
ncbi:MAG: hypothetical protein LBF51_08325 [Zoogloeaceae bacterium]|jgi:hypothetical protein|nr:hypothetical protein [Zoogloeaceae bacterium]